MKIIKPNNVEIRSDNVTYSLNRLPDHCPYCHKGITPNVLFGHRNKNHLETMMYCPDNECNQAFIAYYYVNLGSSTVQYLNTSQGTLIGRNFSVEIIEISSLFVSIYNQAFAAEQQNLKEICGVGYRKALEFLIKDYTILNNEAEKEEIEKATLGNVINKYVDDIRIKSVSKRAVWLGNDETHYIRKWEGKNLEDLKKLIDLTVHWIEMETLTSSFETAMPEK